MFRVISNQNLLIFNWLQSATSLLAFNPTHGSLRHHIKKGNLKLEQSTSHVTGKLLQMDGSAVWFGWLPTDKCWVLLNFCVALLLSPNQFFRLYITDLVDWKKILRWDKIICRQQLHSQEAGWSVVQNPYRRWKRNFTSFIRSNHMTLLPELLMLHKHFYHHNCSWLTV